MTSNVVAMDPEYSAALPPHNAEVEAGLLGALLTSDHAYDRVADILSADDFYEPVHGRIFAAIAKLVEQGKKATPQILARHFDGDEELAEAGGGQYLYELAAGVISIAGAKDYAQQIRDLAIMRGLVEVGRNIEGMATTTSLDETPAEILDFAYGQLDDLSKMPGEAQAETLHDAGTRALAAHEAAWKNKGEVTGLATGFIDLDHKTAGLHPGDLIILAGRPSMGKSALAGNIAANAARNEKRAYFASLEMSAEQLATREQAIRAGIPVDRIRRGDLSDDEFQRLIGAQNQLRALPLIIDADPGLSIQALRSRVRRARRAGGVDLVVVDYLQLMESSAHARRYGNKVQEVSEITRGLKQLAKEMNLPVIALSQLSRQVEQRDDKRPTLADLRESGSIEQDADVVMFIYREEMINPTEENSGLAELIIGKQRNGPVGSIQLAFSKQFTRFDSLYQETD